MLEDCNVARYLSLSADGKPDQTAIVTSRKGKVTHSLSFLELERLSNSVAASFHANGITRGKRVLLMVKPGLGLIASVFALFKIGAPPIVIDPGMGLKGFLRCVQHSRPEALVGIPLAHRVSRLFAGSFQSVQHRVRIDDEFLKQAEAEFQGMFKSAFALATDPAAILFTSGSTGPAKGVCYEHGMFEGQVRMLRETYSIQPGEVDLPMLPIFALFNPAMGMTTIVPEMNPSRPATVDPAGIVRAIHRHEVTNSFGSPVLWRKMVEYCEKHEETLPTLRRVLMAGAPVSPDVIRRLKKLMPNGEVFTPYGATEVLPVSSISGSEILNETWQETQQGKGTCVGRVLPEVQTRIIPRTDKPLISLASAGTVPNGDVGEILVTGPTVTKAYDGLPEATAKAKVEDGSTVWHRMGDLGYFDPKGRLWFCGRKAECVETVSGLLYTDCVEGVFNQHPGVFRTALIGLGKKGRQIPLLAVEPTKMAWPRSREAKAKLLGELVKLGAGHTHTAQISYFIFCKKFPVDVRHNAKINRLTLAARPLKTIWTTALEKPQEIRVTQATFSTK